MWTTCRTSGGRSVAGAYAVRARPTPTVSTPLKWADLSGALDPTLFTVDTVAQRFASYAAATYGLPCRETAEEYMAAVRQAADPG